MNRAGRDEWAKRVQRWKDSGLEAEKFAESEKLNANTLRWWSSRLRRTPKKAAPPEFVEVVAGKPARTRVPTQNTASLELVMSHGVRVVVPIGFDEKTLRRLLHAVKVG